eukprot:TRINITY_DN2545_c0_g1_i3.p1 TRINITY_DN2545_c0_g1~~TRINITY_DN2545_c0_g1_i3.p1  ORF type:complete len:386 (-),score=73.02 TRINITY_DN2545_c0_g1_i3:115-1272(-)
MIAHFIILSLLTIVNSLPEEDFGYVTVRPHAHMFWWLYGKADNATRNTAPLVVWLQGGPGGSSTGFGNFEEIGPLDVNLNPRPINWVQSANVLFIDNPVGTGYSYVTSNDAFCTTDQQIGIDLVTTLKSFVRRHSVFQKNPLYIFSESYGGKMATSFGVALLDAINKKQITVNFKGVTLGDSWISPISFVDAWADYLLSTSEVDNKGYEQIVSVAKQCDQAVASGSWGDATNCWGDSEGVVESVTDGINFYNILQRSGGDDSTKFARKLFAFSANDLNSLMNGPIRKKIGIIPQSVVWGGQSDNVFSFLSNAFMQPIITGVDTLLKAGINVNVESGNLDLICCTPGTIAWMKQLKWSEMNNFWNSQRQSMFINSTLVSFKKHRSL